jgi:hypothetical protein
MIPDVTAVDRKMTLDPTHEMTYPASLTCSVISRAFLTGATRGAAAAATSIAGVTVSSEMGVR